MEEEFCFEGRTTKSDDVLSAKVAYGDPVYYFQDFLKIKLQSSNFVIKRLIFKIPKKQQDHGDHKE